MARLLGGAIPGDARVTGYEAHEALSRPFAVDVELSTEDTSFRAAACLRSRALLTVVDPQGRERHFEGVVDRARFRAARAGRFHFAVRLRPAIAALEHREGSRIFQGMSAVDVVKRVLADAGIDKGVEWRLRQSYAPREIIVQYRETELDFIHRLLEDEGIFYFFSHDEGGHGMIVADDPSAFTAPAGASLVTLSLSPEASAGAWPLAGFSRTVALRPTALLLRDYDFERPQQKPEGRLQAPGGWPLPRYEYPGGFTQGPEGARRTRARLAAERRDADTVRGRSSAVGLTCGAPFQVEGGADAHHNGTFVVTELRSTGKQGTGAGVGCENELVGIPAGASFAPPRATKKPRIRGLQTGVVTGPTNEQQAIHVDKYGRIKVRFHWDRAGKQDDTTSAWVRVAQPPLGGAMILPRVGWEVSMAFLVGDPDRPLVLGRVYNAEKTPPYALPAEAAAGSLKSMSSPGAARSNELKTNDTGGSQAWGMSAARDLNVSVGGDKTETVGVNETHTVGSNLKITITANETVTVGGDQSVDVGNALRHGVSGSQSIHTGGNEQTSAKADYEESIGGARDYTVGGNQLTISNGVIQEITGAFTRHVGAIQVTASPAAVSDNLLAGFDETVGAVKIELVGGASAESVSVAKHLTSTAAEVHVAGSIATSAASVMQLIGGVHLRKVGGNYVVSAKKILLGGAVGRFKAGGSSIKLGGGPVVIKGPAIAIKAGAIVKLGSSLKLS